MSLTQQKAFSYFVGMGWAPVHSAGLVANLVAESNLNPNAVGDGGLAYGIGQWHPDRQANFAAIMGRDIHGSSLDDQLAFVHAELQRWEKRAGDALRACTTAAEAGACVSMQYERPADRDGEAKKRAALAEAIFQAYGGSAGSTPWVEGADRTPILEPERPALTPTNVQPEKQMPAILAQLLPMVLGMFSQGGQAQLQPITSRPADQIGPFLMSLFSQIGQQTGVLPAGQQIKTDAEAVAAVAELAKQKQANADLIASIERKALTYLADMAPLFDRLQAADAAENAARLAGRQSASSVAIEEHKAGLWDMTRTLVTSLLIMLWGIAWGLGGAIIGMVFKEKPDPTLIAALIGLAGPIWAGAIVASVVAIVAYRFDGSSATNAARAIHQQLDIASKRVQ